MSSISSIINGGFLTRLVTSSLSGTSSTSSSSSENLPASITDIKSGLRLGAERYVQAFQNVNDLNNLMSATEETLAKLEKIVDKVIKVATVASRRGTSGLSSANTEFQKLARDYKKLVADTELSDGTALVEKEGIETVFRNLGLNEEVSSSLATVFSRFVTPGKLDKLADDTLRGQRPIRTTTEETSTETTAAGTFQAVVTLTAPGVVGEVTTGDFDGDGNQDIAYMGTSNPLSGELSNDTYLNIRRGNGNGTFAAAVSFHFGSQPFAGLETANFDADGKDEVVFRFVNGSPNVIAAYEMTGTVISLVGPLLSVPDVSSQYYAIGNIDGDANDEFVTTDTNKNILISSGSYTITQTISDGAFPGGGVTLRDFTGDGKTDIGVLDKSDTTIYHVYAGNGDGTFSTTSTYSDFTDPLHYATFGDINNDSKIDIYSIDVGLGVASFHFGNGDGTFGPQVTFGGAPAVLNNPVLADYNEDGNLDSFLLVAGQIGISDGNGNGTFDAPYFYANPGTSQRHNIVVSDMNDDGFLDLVTSTSNSITLRIQNSTTSTTTTEVTRKPPIELETLFYSGRTIASTGDAKLVLNDAKVLKEQIQKNRKALKETKNYLADNLSLIRSTALGLFDIGNNLTSAPSAEDLAFKLRSAIAGAPAAARNTADTLDPLFARTLLSTS